MDGRFVPPKEVRVACTPRAFIESPGFFWARTILYFPSSPILFFYEKQAASGRAPAGMPGIFGRRVVPGKTVVRIIRALLLRACARVPLPETYLIRTWNCTEPPIQSVVSGTAWERSRLARKSPSQFDRDSWGSYMGRTILWRFRTRDRGDSYLRLINYCPYPIPALSSPTYLRSSGVLSRVQATLEPLLPRAPAAKPPDTGAQLNINLPHHCPLLLLTYLTDFYFYCFLVHRPCRLSRVLFTSTYVWQFLGLSFWIRLGVRILRH